ncbi:MAG: UbiA prenyltransferase family protein [Bacteroidota bacterium]
MKEIITLLRPHQYVKNLFLFFPAFFALRITEIDVWLKLGLAFVAFSAIASAVYILNDYLDRKADAQHPVKKHRPLAAGTVSSTTAFLLMSGLLIFGLSIFAFLSKQALYLVTAYVAMNILYSIKLKHIPILDIFIIALGFVIRIGLGAVSVERQIPLSMWIVLMTFLGALFIALAKRRDDVRLAEEGLQVRKSISGYNLPFINGAMMIMASVLIVSYISYTISPEVQARFGSKYLYISVGFVIMGLFRYLQITFVEERSGSPTKILLSDVFLQLTIIGWLGLLFWLIYLA